jgi:hypothetical protein
MIGSTPLGERKKSFGDKFRRFHQGGIASALSLFGCVEKFTHLYKPEIGREQRIVRRCSAGETGGLRGSLAFVTAARQDLSSFSERISIEPKLS